MNYLNYWQAFVPLALLLAFLGCRKFFVNRKPESDGEPKDFSALRLLNEPSKITVDALMRFTEFAPMKQINIAGKPYLQRYYLGTTSSGLDMWVHRFLSCDPDRHLHNHPFEFHTMCLHGGYVELLKTPFGIVSNNLFARDLSVLNLDFDRLKELLIFSGVNRGIGSWHRIAKVMPDTWTVLLVDRNNRVPFWYFEEDGEYVVNRGSGPDWFLNAKTRAEQAEIGVVQ